MQALVFDGQLRFMQHYPTPAAVSGEALIHPILVGICNTDIEIIQGYKGFHGVLGHEFVGIVVACEDPAWVGQRIVGEINAACFRCAVCLRGDWSHCPERTTLGMYRRDGAMAEYVNLPISCLHRVPDGVSNEDAVFTEPLAAALEIVEQSHVRPTDRIAVVGDGKLGILCAQVLRLTGGEVVMVGRHPERWDWLRALGIATSAAGDMSGGYDLVVDCTGSAAGLATARKLVRPRGRLMIKSTIAAETQLDLTQIVVDEIQLLGSRCGPFGPALRLLERRLVRVEPLIAERYPLDQGVAAFDAARRRLKILLEV